MYTYSRIHPWSFGLALGVVWGLSLLIAGLVAMATGWGQGFIDTMGTVYLGFQATVVGSIIGAAWAFIDLFIFGVIIASIYNLFLRICCKSICRHTAEKITVSKKKTRQSNNSME